MNVWPAILVTLCFCAFCSFVLRKKYLAFKKKEINIFDFVETIIIAATCFAVQGIIIFAVISVNFK